MNLPQQHFHILCGCLITSVLCVSLEVVDVRLRDADEAGGAAGWRLFLHRLPLFRRHRLSHRPRYVHFLSFQARVSLQNINGAISQSQHERL